MFKKKNSDICQFQSNAHFSLKMRNKLSSMEKAFKHSDESSKFPCKVYQNTLNPKVTHWFYGYKSCLQVRAYIDSSVYDEMRRFPQHYMGQANVNPKRQTKSILDSHLDLYDSTTGLWHVKYNLQDPNLYKNLTENWILIGSRCAQTLVVFSFPLTP